MLIQRQSTPDCTQVAVGLFCFVCVISEVEQKARHQGTAQQDKVKVKMRKTDTQKKENRQPLNTKTSHLLQG